MKTHKITIHPAEVHGGEVMFSWSINPPQNLYIKNRFTLNFPAFVDLSKVPESLWWRIALICLHSQWPLLRPCEVHLPVRLNPGEAETWSRLLETEITTLEYYRGSKGFSRRIEILDDGPELSTPPAESQSDLCATAFSGGKDSLTQVGLLSELGYKPALVTTTSPVPWTNDHKTWRRRHVLKEIQRRRDVTLVEVETDFRRNFHYFIAPGIGDEVAINVITDTLLYSGILIAAGYALGARHFFLAAENEVHETMKINGEIVQHPHYMYSVITQASLAAILRPLGISYSAMTSPVRASQVQELLWTRYADLSDLQYSCWLAKRHQKICSRCSQCLRLAFGALAAGGDPSLIGVRWIKLLNANSNWIPRRMENLASALTPQLSTGIHLDAQTARSIIAISPEKMEETLKRESFLLRLTPSGRNAMKVFLQMRERAIASHPGPPPGYRPGFLKFVDGLVRDGLESIYSSRFSIEEPSQCQSLISLIDERIKWITEPIDNNMMH